MVITILCRAIDVPEMKGMAPEPVELLDYRP